MNSTVLIACFLVQSADDPLIVAQGKGMQEKRPCGYGDEGG
jgi:hypothetical protein